MASPFPILVIGSIVSSVALIITNKLAFATFTFPIALTCLHQLFGTVFSQGLMAFGVVQRHKLPVLDAFLMSATFCGGLVFMNFSLAANSVGFYQIFKLLCTPCVAFLQYVLYGRAISVNMIIALGLLLTGVGIATVTDLAGNWWGVTLGTFAVVLTSYSQVLMNRLQSQHNLDAFQTMNAISPFSFLILACCTIIMEMPGENGLIAHVTSPNELFLILLSGVLAILSNYFGFAIIRIASAISYQVVGHSKTCLTVLLGIIFFTPLVPQSWDYIARTSVGLAVAIVGLVLFSSLSAKPKPEPSTGGLHPLISRLFSRNLFSVRLFVGLGLLYLIFASVQSFRTVEGSNSNKRRQLESFEIANCSVCEKCTVCEPCDPCPVPVVCENTVKDCSSECALLNPCPTKPDCDCFDNLHKQPNQKETIGVIYVLGLRSPVIEAYANKFASEQARQDSYLNELEHSITSLRKFNPTLPVTLFIDKDDILREDLKKMFSDVIVQKEAAKVEWGDKALALPISPYDRTIFLDNDVTVCEDLTPFFPFVDNYDMAAVLEPRLVTEVKRFARDKAVYQYSSFNLTHFNSGMILFKKSQRMMTLFKNWRAEHEKAKHGGDQYYLSKLLPHHNIRVLTLPAEFNLRFNDNVLPIFLQSSVKILHTRTVMRNPNKLSCEIVNSVQAPRLFDPIRHSVFSFYVDDVGNVRTAAIADNVQKSLAAPFNLHD